MGDYEGDGSISQKFMLYPGVSFRSWTKPGFGWCFAQIAAADLSALQADPDIYILPDGTMDVSVGSIPAGVRTTMRTRLEAAGFTFGDVKTTWTIRQLLLYVARQLQPDINVEVGDVRDVEA
jgi:hypothetical protein